MMYLEYFGLKEAPFSIAPDPRYLYMSEQHREALAHLVYGVNSDNGFILLTGEVGTGKTTVCRCLLDQMQENCDTAFILNPKMTAEELLATICDELGISYPDGNISRKLFVDKINAYFLDANARGRRTILIIEEAQNLALDVLEQVRLLTNLETNQRKLLQIIMLGQPELREIFSRPELMQLSQRITARYHLCPLSRREVGTYVTHRLAVAGVIKKLFPQGTIDKLYRLSGGIPRLINIICDRALLGAYVQGKDSVDRSTLVKAAMEVSGKGRDRIQSMRLLRWGLSGLVLIGFIVGFVMGLRHYEPDFLASVILQNPFQRNVTEPLLAQERIPERTSLKKSFSSSSSSEYDTFCLSVNDQGLPCELEGLGMTRYLNSIGIVSLVRNPKSGSKAAFSEPPDRSLTVGIYSGIKEQERDRIKKQQTVLIKDPEDRSSDMRSMNTKNGG
jgi:type II secretory pathway predicted ATPase ExeA